MSPVRIGSVASLVLCALLGCTSTKSIVQKRFATDYACSADAVTVSERGSNIYAASGCGKSAEYVCGTFTGTNDDTRRCSERGVNRKDPGPPPPPLRQNEVPPK